METEENKTTEIDIDVMLTRLQQIWGHTDFREKQFSGSEYEYKYELSQRTQELLAREALDQLIEQENWSEICQRVVRCFQHRYSLARWDEFQWVRELEPDEQQPFALALNDFLYGEDPFLDRLERFVAGVTEVYQAFRERDPKHQKNYKRQSLTWPFVSYFHFMLWPDQEYVFIKPSYLWEAARASGFDLQYHSRPNRRTYANVQEFYRAIWPTVQSLGARDWIDIQGLLHVVAGGYGVPKGGWADRPEPEPAVAPPTPQAPPKVAETLPMTALLSPPPPSLDEILARVAESRYVFADEIVTNYHLSLLTKPFVILTGLSGTGKTKLTRLYADAVYGVSDGAVNNYYDIVAVRPDWTDSRGLLGYYNPLTRAYEATPFLRFMMRAISDPEHWYYLCLDEMNLARVEYYFSDFLSAMESGEPIALHSFDGQCLTTKAGEVEQQPEAEMAARGYLVDGVLCVPATLHIPRNLLISGTVNVDETTHAFSDKVLDRANSIEFNRTDLERFAHRYRRRYPDRAALLDEVMPLLFQVYDTLEPYYLHFGYRTLEEMFDYLWQNDQLPENRRLEREAALDNQLMQKVLPKLRGDERIEDALEELQSKLTDVLGERSRAVDKLDWMMKELRAFGSTQFWR